MAADHQVHQITGARRPHSDDLDRRMSRYLISMLIRTICFLLIFAVHGPVRWVFAAAALLLPYIAVVMANTGRPPREAPPTLGVPPPTPRQLDDAAADHHDHIPPNG